MLAFSKTMANELASDKILANSICPALIHTPLWDRLADSMIGAVGASREEVFQNLPAQFVPLGRFGAVEEVAGLVAFLASERATFIAGASFDVDGGCTLRSSDYGVGTRAKPDRAAVHQLFTRR